MCWLMRLDSPVKLFLARGLGAQGCIQVPLRVMPGLQAPATELNGDADAYIYMCVYADIYEWI